MTDQMPIDPFRHGVPIVAAARPARGRSHLRSIAVIGASGFIGSATLRALAGAYCLTTAVVRERPRAPRPGVRYVVADVTDLRSLTQAVVDVDVLVHAATYTGSDEGLCEMVNYVGTQNILAAADVHKIGHVINTSTIGVYGLGPFHDVVEDKRDPAPVTVLSATRAAADHLVRSHGGITVRPGFVYGPGDRWFLPGLRSILSQTRTWVDEGSALLSVISVGELGELIAALALDCSDEDKGGLFHAARPNPVSIRDLASSLLGETTESCTRNCSYDDAALQIADLGITPRQLDLIGRDHWIDSQKMWSRTSRIPSVIPFA